MVNEWFQNFANIILRFDLDAFKDDPIISFALETNWNPGQETLCKRITVSKIEFWRITMPFKDVTDSATIIAATKIEHCLICRP